MTGSAIYVPVAFETRNMFVLLIHRFTNFILTKFKLHVIYKTICATTLWFPRRALFIPIYTLKISRIKSNELIFLSRLLQAATFRFDHLPYEFIKRSATFPDVNNDLNSK